MMQPVARDEAEVRVIEATLAAYRAAMGRGEPEALPLLTEEEFRRALKRRGLGSPDTRDRVVATLRRMTDIEAAWGPPRAGSRVTPYDGPRVILTKTLPRLDESWEEHVGDLVDGKGASGEVVRRHRTSVAHYCRAARIRWFPETEEYEQRSRKARSRRSDAIQLPDDFLDRLKRIYNNAHYHKDPAYNEELRACARFSGYTAPRIPSEASRFQLDHTSPERGRVTYYISKTAGVEEEPILIPRDLPARPASVMTWDARRSLRAYLQKVRPKLVNRAISAGIIEADHGFVWVGVDGLPVESDTLRRDLARGMKSIWPSSYPYELREIGLIMFYLENAQSNGGAADLEACLDFSGHEKWDTFRRYMRKGRRMLRENKPGPVLNNFMFEWWQL